MIKNLRMHLSSLIQTIKGILEKNNFKIVDFDLGWNVGIRLTLSAACSIRSISSLSLGESVVIFNSIKSSYSYSYFKRILIFKKFYVLIMHNKWLSNDLIKTL